MYAKKKVMGVTGRSINKGVYDTGDAENMIRRASGAPQKVEGSLSLMAGGSGGHSMSVNAFWQSNYQYYMTGIIPADPHLIDTSTLSLFYRDIYLFDNVAGSAVDIQSHFPFSDWELRGLDDEDLEPYNIALERLNIRQMLPLISVAHLTDGFFAGSLVFDPRNKQFIDTLVHDALSVAAIPSPFFNIDPTLNVRVGQATQQFMHDTSEYARRYLDTMPHQFIEMLRSGAFTLDPVTTLFIPRRSTTDRAYTSYLHRILPMYLIEKTLYRGTLVEAQRRQRAMTHVTAGDDTWTPTGEELFALVREFQSAETDPLGGWVATRNAVQSVDLRPGGDFWRWMDVADVLVPYKLRALGISESFMSGEASYAAAESAYSTFLETQNSYRTDLTERIFYSKLFPLIAVVNDLYKEGTNRAKQGRIIDFLFNKANRQNLKMPQLHWFKELEAKGEENMMELLEMASDKGVPVPLKMWMTAAKIDPDALERDLKEDAEYRQQLEQYTGKDTSHEGEDHIQGFGQDYEREIDNAEEPEMAALLNRVYTGPTTASIANGHAGYRRPLMAREWEDGDTWSLTKTGKVRHDPHPQTARRNWNDMIYKIAARATKDQNYREELKKRNKEKLGRTTLK